MRGEEEKRRLINRISRIEGQIKGIRRMLTEDEYCPNVLVQIEAARAALTSLSKQMAIEHINTCVLEDIKSGNTDAAGELAELMGRLLK